MNRLFALSIIVLPLLILGCQMKEDIRNINMDEIHTEYISGKVRLPYTAKIYRFEKSSNDSVVYYFHGVGGAADSFDYIVMNNRLPSDFPTVVSVSFGKIWFLTNGGDISQPIIEAESFVDEMLLSIEPRLGLHVKDRIVWGYSMGGYNAGLLAYSFPDFFSKVVSVSPSILSISPFKSEAQIEAHIDSMERKYLTIPAKIKRYVFRESHLADHIRLMCKTQKIRFPTEKLWNDNDILQIVQLKNSDLPETYISCGTRDENSLYEGASILSERLMKHNTNVQFISLKGGHTAIDLPSIVSFVLLHD